MRQYVLGYTRCDYNSSHLNVTGQENNNKFCKKGN